MADAVRQTTQQLRDQRHDTAAQYVEQAASQIDRFSDMLRRKDVGELVEDAQRLARRQPALFIGSAFGIGLIGARFLKSTPPDRHMERAHAGTARAPYRQDDSASRVQGLPSNRVGAPEEPFNG